MHIQHYKDRTSLRWTTSCGRPLHLRTNRSAGKSAYQSLESYISLRCFLQKSQASGVKRGQREHRGSFRGYPKQRGGCGVLLTPVSRIRAISPLKLPSLNTSLDTYLYPLELRPISLLTLWISGGLTQAFS